MVVHNTRDVGGSHFVLATHYSGGVPTVRESVRCFRPIPRPSPETTCCAAISAAGGLSPHYTVDKGEPRTALPDQFGQRSILHTVTITFPAGCVSQETHLKLRSMAGKRFIVDSRATVSMQFNVKSSIYTALKIKMAAQETTSSSNDLKHPKHRDILSRELTLRGK